MSSSLTVVYGARQFKVPVTPSTLLSQVRDEVCAGPHGLGLPSARYGLARQGKPLDLTQPLRFTGLVNNAHIDLVRLTADAQAPIRVKVRIPNGKDFVHTFAGSTSVGEVAAAAGLAGTPLTLGGSTQIDPASELLSLGGGASGLLFTAPRTGAATAPRAGATASVPSRGAKTGAAGGAASGSSGSSTGSVSGASARAAAPAPRGVDRDAAVVTGSPSFSAAAIDEPPEMGMSQFRAYQAHLMAQAEPAMLSKETRERLRTEKRGQVETTTIRIKLPDQSFLQGKFQRGERGEQVYSFVRTYLRTPSQPFVLKQLNPTLTLAPEHHLLDDCHLGSRALLIFEWRTPPKSAAPILNDKAMELVRPVADGSGPGAAEKKAPGAIPAGAGAAAAGAAVKTEDTPEPRKRDAIKKAVPKWMRLHKS